MKKLKPRKGRVLFRLNPVAEKKASPDSILVIPDEHTEPNRIGTVVRVGEGVDDLKEGDQIVVSYYTGKAQILYELNEIDDTLRVCLEDEIPVTLED